MYAAVFKKAKTYLLLFLLAFGQSNLGAQASPLPNGTAEEAVLLGHLLKRQEEVGKGKEDKCTQLDPSFLDAECEKLGRSALLLNLDEIYSTCATVSKERRRSLAEVLEPTVTLLKKAEQVLKKEKASKDQAEKHHLNPRIELVAKTCTQLDAKTTELSRQRKALMMLGFFVLSSTISFVEYIVQSTFPPAR